MKIKIFINNRPYVTLLIVLLVNFLFRVLIFAKTKLFYFSDYSAYLKGIEIIKEKGTIPLVDGNFLYLNSYIGYFFKYVLGNMDYYFIFNCLLGTFTSFFVYLICVKLTGNKLVGLLTVFLHCIYIEFMVFSSIFYTPIIMMFLLSLIILLLIHYFNATGCKKFLIIIALLILVNVTFYFKGELKYLWILILLIGLINFKKKQILIGFVLLGTLLTFSTRALKYYHVLPYKEGNVTANNFIFFGHTLYGGDGGDGSFVYKKNEERYYKALAAYCKRNKIKNPTRIDKNNFQREEIKKFITKHPLKWVNLQFYKFCRYFGVVAETNSYKVLVTGLLKGQRIITAIIVVVPFALMILLIVITVNIPRVKKALYRNEILLMGLLLLYYISGSVFYGHYAERYRLPVIVCFVIPFLSWSLLKFKLKELLNNKITLYLKVGVVVLILVIWVFQTYNALVVHKDRYIKTVRELTSFKNKSANMK